MNMASTSNFSNLPTANANRLVRFWGDLSLARKLLAAFTFLSILTLGVGIDLYLGLNSVQGSFEKALSEGEAMATTSQHMQSNFLIARQHERDFLLGWRSQGFDTAYTNYVIPHQETISEIHEHISELSAFAPMVENGLGKSYTQKQYQADLAVLSQNIDLYQQEFERTINLIQERGFQDTGLEGQFRDKVHNIEDRIYGREGLESLVITMLQIRRREKDYLLRGDQVYIDDVHELVAQLKDQIAASELLEVTEKSELTALADQYIVSFDALVEKDIQIATTIEEFREATQSTEALVEKLALTGTQLSAQDVERARISSSRTLLFSTITLIATLLVAVWLSVALSRQLAQPLLQLTEVAQQIEKGNFEARANEVSHDEIGMLASAFNNMSAKLKNTLDGLERTVADRTKALVTSTEVSRRLSTSLDQRQLVTEVIEQLHSAFNYYDVRIYLFDKAGNKLVMADGSGEAGQTLLARSHKIPNDKGLVDFAAETNTAVLISDVSTDLDWLPNPLLPETQSEVVAPISIGDQVLGVLDVQHNIAGGLKQEDMEIARDVANQLAIALQRTDLYNALQNELTERKKLISELEANNAELERFTYTVSHDLRNPLVTIKGFLGMLEKDIQDGRHERISNDFQRIANAADKMHILLANLLELSRIGRILNPSEEVDLVKLTQDSIETLDAHIRSKNVTVKVSPNLPIVHGDRIRLREVLENLIDNAAKYMGDQRNPMIEIGTKDHEGAQVIFVKDNGMGIEPQHRTRIFSLFEKLDPSSEGTGVGLALIKRIIETHGGKIWVESEGLGKGSTFYFTIPEREKTGS